MARTRVVVAGFSLVFAGLVSISNAQQAAGGATSGTVEQKLVAAYESLADTIIALEKAESALMHSLLAEYHSSAQTHLNEAKTAAAAGQDASKHLEAAAEAIGKLAVEGGRDVEAITLRLQKAGHHHNTAEGQNFEYLLVGPEPRKALLELSKQTGQLASAGKEGLADKIQKLSQDLESEFNKIKS